MIEELRFAGIEIEPYLQNSDDNEIRDILNSDMTDMDKDEKERMFMKMLSAMVIFCNWYESILY